MSLSHLTALILSPSQVNLVLDDGRSLGLMIRGGAEYSLGIYITGVDRGSAAECGGLKVQFFFFVLSHVALVTVHSFLALTIICFNRSPVANISNPIEIQRFSVHSFKVLFSF